MTPANAAKLLALAAAFDNRTFDETTARAWADALSGLDPDDCATALRQHYRTSDRFVMPAHIRTLVRQLANERTERGHGWRELQPAPEQCVPKPAWFDDALAEFSRRRELPA